MPDKHSVFLAEDNPGDADLFRLALSKSGLNYNLSVCTDGAAALAAIAHAESAIVDRRPELFVFDLNLPKVDGLALLRRLRSGKVFRETPVIIWTTSELSKDRLQSNEFGARHIRKPPNLREFMELGGAIRDILNPPVK